VSTISTGACLIFNPIAAACGSLAIAWQSL
jgi:hypothetical protein